MGFGRVGTAFFTLTASQCTYSQLYDMCHPWYVVPECWQLDSGGLKCWLQLASHQVTLESINSWNFQLTAVSKLKTIKHVLQMYGKHCSSMIAVELSSWIMFQIEKGIEDQPHRKRVVLHPRPHGDRYSKKWPTLYRVCWWLSVCAMVH